MARLNDAINKGTSTGDVADFSGRLLDFCRDEKLMEPADSTSLNVSEAVSVPAPSMPSAVT